MPGGLIRSWSIPTEGRLCEIRVGRGLIDDPVPKGATPIAVLAQPAVTGAARDIADRIRTASSRNVSLRVLPDGELAKTSAVVEDTYKWLNTEDFTRDGSIVAVGGGALTDVAGFVAATYLRGVEVTYVPTTLLGAVDAAIGGKTGFNVGGKNLAGVFRHPHRILVDLDVLEALPLQLRRVGSAEIIKAGFIADPGIVAAYERNGLAVDLEFVVPAAIEVKVKAVAADFRESGTRAILNYGHTLGHAIEVAAGISHGEAISVGMVAAGRVSAEMVGFEDEERQQNVLAGIGLPITAPAVDSEELMSLISRDKKRDASGIRMVLLEAFGKPVLRHVDQAAIQLGLEAVGLAGA
ncbi:MAG: 3-dehydroquinate synthase family protein [Acidimicrobiia bacterium]|nr:3-dehydroquinate synthase family protein [Acidimicrobiia bacterium]